MNGMNIRRFYGWPLVCFIGLMFVLLLVGSQTLLAQNISSYSDTISDSAPGAASNHTFRFTPREAIAPGGQLAISFPSDFSVATTSFGVRNVELVVGGVARSANTTTGPGTDGVTITTGPGGGVQYNLHTGAGIPADASVELRVGNHTSQSVLFETTFSTSTGTTTSPVDIEPITNSTSIGTHTIDLEVIGAGEVMAAGFSIAVVNRVGTGNVDTTELIPPERFDGAPSSTVGGTTQFVELSLETNEFAICRYSDTAGVSFASMTSVFPNTGIIFHSGAIVPVTAGELNTYYVRCQDDEGNINIDDYEINFVVGEVPTGTANTEGDTSGDGTGSGDDGTGTGDGSGGTSGSQDGEVPTTGGSSGGGGSGGGGGGGSGGGSGGGGGGSQNNDQGPFESGEATIVISGLAPASTEVTILVDGQQAGTTNVNRDGSFSITFDDVARGAYTFGIFAEDNAGGRSSTFSTSFTVSGNRISNLSGITITPTIQVKPNPVDLGETAVASGVTLPGATVTIENQRQGTVASRQTFTTTSGSNGAWSYDIQTVGFPQDTYELRVKADGGNLGSKTGFSNFVPYGVGQKADIPLNADLNRDGRVNLTDFSILLFWWGTAGGSSNPPADINQDGSVSLTDFSILLFNWTG